MSAQRTSFEKLQRDRAKKARAAAKRDKRQNPEAEAAASSAEADALATDALMNDDGGELSAADLLKLVEAIHNQFDAKLISFEDFEEQKAELMRRLPID